MCVRLLYAHADRTDRGAGGVWRPWTRVRRDFRDYSTYELAAYMAGCCAAQPKTHCRV